MGKGNLWGLALRGWSVGSGLVLSRSRLLDNKYNTLLRCGLIQVGRRSSWLRCVSHMRVFASFTLPPCLVRIQPHLPPAAPTGKYTSDTPRLGVTDTRKWNEGDELCLCVRVAPRAYARLVRYQCRLKGGTCHAGCLGAARLPQQTPGSHSCALAAHSSGLAAFNKLAASVSGFQKRTANAAWLGLCANHSPCNATSRQPTSGCDCQGNSRVPSIIPWYYYSARCAFSPDLEF